MSPQQPAPIAGMVKGSGQVRGSGQDTHRSTVLPGNSLNLCFYLSTFEVDSCGHLLGPPGSAQAAVTQQNLREFKHSELKQPPSQLKPQGGLAASLGNSYTSLSPCLEFQSKKNPRRGSRENQKSLSFSFGDVCAFLLPGSRVWGMCLEG